MTVRNAVRKAADPRAFVPGARAGQRGPSTIEPARASTMPRAGGVESEQVRTLLDEIERIAGSIEHVAAISDSLGPDENFGQETIALLAARRGAINQGLSGVLEIYASDLKCNVDYFRRFNAEELKAG